MSGQGGILTAPASTSTSLCPFGLRSIYAAIGLLLRKYTSHHALLVCLIAAERVSAADSPYDSSSSTMVISEVLPPEAVVSILMVFSVIKRLIRVS